MKLTSVLCKQHWGRQFKAHWVVQGKRRIKQTMAESALLDEGITVVDPKETLTPALQYEPFELPKEELPVIPEMPLCHFLSPNFKPIDKMHQVQILTNTIVFDSLPDVVLNTVQQPSKQEEKLLQESILHAHLLDAEQKKLPRIPKNIFIKPRLTYGITNTRKHKLLIYQLLLLLDKFEQVASKRYLIEDPSSSVTLNFEDNIMHLNYEADYMLVSKQALYPILAPLQLQDLCEYTAMPDLFPLSPLANTKQETKYEKLDTHFCVSGRQLFPHTLFVHFPEPQIKDSPHLFYSRTLLNAFSHTAAFVKQENMTTLNGDLSSPVTMNIVHSHGPVFHFGVFQLNSLNLTGNKRNIFWHSKWHYLYSKCQFSHDLQHLKDLSIEPYNILKALHGMGI